MTAIRTSISSDGVLLADGQPFFVRGLYASELMQNKPDTKPSDLHALYDNFALIAQAGYNTVLSYAYGATRVQSEVSRFLDAAQRHNLSVILNVDIYDSECTAGKKPVAGANAAVEAFVRATTDHPAVLMYYINDEHVSQL